MHVRFLAARCAGVRPYVKGRLSGRRRGFFVAALAALALAGAATAAAPAIAATARAEAPSVAAASVKWHKQSIPSGLADLHLQSVSCAKDGEHCMTGGIFCTASGCGGLISFAILSTTNGGKTWKRRSLPKELGDIGSISCGSTTFCVAPVTKGLPPNNKESFLVTRNGGSSWKVVTTPGDDTVGGLSCPSASTCFAGSYISPNDVIDKTTDGGSKWTSKTAPAYASKISCASASHCVALADGGFMYTTNGGSSWHLVSAPGSPSLSAISCASQSACYAAGTNSSDTGLVVLATSNGGKSWTTRTLPSGIDDVGGIACATSKRCVVAGDINKNDESNRVIYATTDSGSRWTKQSVPTGTGDLDDVWCSAKSYCLASGISLKFSKGSISAISPYLMAS
jgi:photosystem II stability/assembly factor-like uncharacterized protein